MKKSLFIAFQRKCKQLSTKLIFKSIISEKRFLTFQALLVISGFLYTIYAMIISPHYKIAFIIPIMEYLFLFIYTCYGFNKDKIKYFNLTVIVVTINMLFNALQMFYDIFKHPVALNAKISVGLLSIIMFIIFIYFFRYLNNYKKAISAVTFATILDVIAFIPLSGILFVNNILTLNFIFLLLIITIALIYRLNFK